MTRAVRTEDAWAAVSFWAVDLVTKRYKTNAPAITSASASHPRHANGRFVTGGGDATGFKDAGGCVDAGLSPGIADIAIVNRLLQAMTGSQIRKSITGEQWKILFAAQAGYLLDAMDVLLYVFAINALKHEFGFSNRMAGLVSSVTLIASAVGGIHCGVLSDRLGRVRMLAYTIWLYSLASAGAATSQSFGALLFWRAIVGMGLGGEWSAGAVLVAESWPAEWRVRATAFMQSGWAFGYMLAAGVTAVVLPRFGWRALFLTGLAPALLAFAIRTQHSRTGAVEADSLRQFVLAHLSPAARPQDLAGFGAVRVCIIRLLGPVHLDSGLSFGSGVGGRRRTQLDGNQRLGYSDAVWGVSRLSDFWLYGGSARPTAGLPPVRAGFGGAGTHLRLGLATAPRIPAGVGCWLWVRWLDFSEPDISDCLARCWPSCIRAMCAARVRASHIISAVR